jgi:hypothetical protein
VVFADLDWTFSLQGAASALAVAAHFVQAPVDYLVVEMEDHSLLDARLVSSAVGVEVGPVVVLADRRVSPREDDSLAVDCLAPPPAVVQDPLSALIPESCQVSAGGSLPVGCQVGFVLAAFEELHSVLVRADCPVVGVFLCLNDCPVGLVPGDRWAAQ